MKKTTLFLSLKKIGIFPRFNERIQQFVKILLSKIKVKYNDFDNQNFLINGKILSALHYLFIEGPKTVSMIKKSIIK